MPDINELATEIGNLFIGVAKDIYGRFKQEDKDALTSYAKNVAALTLKLRAEADPVRRASLIDDLKTYQNATQLMIARYELIAANSLEKAGVEALNLAAAALIKIVIAAL